jgi:NADH:ubiquinone oxidoreductase subunit 5 (subunit L)/multisubunit Na+/H+ antiporter MnhA subunit
MAETVRIEGESYLKRDPLGVLALSIVTIGIYFFYWYYKVNDEIRRFEHDQTVRPGMALLAVTLGWLIIVPPFISVYNTSMHIQKIEQRLEIQQQLSPALNVILLIVVAAGLGMYSQEHLNRIWEVARGASGSSGPAEPGALPSPPA